MRISDWSSDVCSSDLISAKKAQSILREAPGIMLVDKREDGGYVTPVECVGDIATYISRVREDSTVENGLTLWCVSDNLRTGRSEEHTSELQSLMRISYAVFCLKKKKNRKTHIENDKSNTSAALN